MLQRANRFTKASITDYADDILDIGETKNKWTNTNEDDENDWKLIKS